MTTAKATAKAARTDPLLVALHRAWLMGLLPAERRLRRALTHPARVQARLLARVVAKNARTAYGRAHGFERVDSLASFQRRVPITDYDALAPWLTRVQAAEPGVLTAEPVRLFERSGGSTRATTKLIPYTAGLLADFSAATNPWLADMYRRHPGLVGTRAYWSLSPVVQGERRTAGGVPIGMADDTEYFGPVRRFVLGRTMAVPPSVAHLPDFTAWRRATLRHLLAADDLGLVSVWSPTFLSVLLDALHDDLDAILADLPAARARAVRDAVAAGPDFGPRIWPRLALISCWMDGPARDHLAPLRRCFPSVALQPKGLLATEGVVSIPYGPGDGGVLALTSHVLEFIDPDAPHARPLLPHELRVGASYSPLLTTSGGLYRYHLKDVVTCVAPLRVRFSGKLDQVADLVGEKVHAHQVEAALERARAEVPFDFALLAPVTTDRGRHYCLYLECAAPPDRIARVGALVESHLLAGHAYRYARDLGQLGPLRVQPVHRGRERMLEALIAAGRRAGDIKPTVLDARPIWADVFGAGERSPEENDR